jgi:phospho-N-acetylmuramoyl-pentapeptide-transferase
MLYYLSELTGWYSPLRIFKYITFRALGGAATAFLISLVIGPWLIRRLQDLRVGQFIRKEEAPDLHVLHGKKQGTPTMGGLLILMSVTVSTLLWSNPQSMFIHLTLATMLAMGAIGFLDDYAKLRGKSAKGMSARAKFLLQVVWAVGVVSLLLILPETRDWVGDLWVPFLKTPAAAGLPIPVVYIYLGLVLVGAANAVNLTDGLDGLAIGCSGSVALAYLVMSYTAGHVLFAEYLRVPYVAGSGELAVYCGCLLGASLGFLWFNCHPAKVFMGDTGSLALGGGIAMVAILIRQEIALILVGGVFVMEAMSVILQVASFKMRGKRIFLMAPIHHHFELRGWSETQVTIRFWILSILFALLGVATLKIR